MLAIIGRVPSEFTGAVRVSDFRQFQKIAGQLESASGDQYPALHAVCHAVMNGCSPVLFLGVADLSSLPVDLDPIRAEARFELVTAPGLTDLEAITALSAGLEPGETLWVDAARGSDPTKLQRALGDRARVAAPWVATISPGRRSPEALPPTCLIGPLLLGSASTLRGVHDPPRRLDASVRAALEAGGGALLEATGRRRQVGLAFPRPETSPAPTTPTLEGEIRDALLELCAPLVAGEPNSPRLWAIVEREGRALLSRIQRSGRISGFHLRCDEETNMDADEGELGVEVIIETPQRVRQVIIRLS